MADPHDHASDSATSSTGDRDASSNVLEMRQPAAAEAEAPAAPAAPEQRAQTAENEGGMGLSTLILGALLLASLAFNFIQSQGRASLEAQSNEYATALDRTIVRLDEETFRANDAQATIDAIDANVDNVNTRIGELQEALTKLSEITAR